MVSKLDKMYTHTHTHTLTHTRSLVLEEDHRAFSFRREGVSAGSSDHYIHVVTLVFSRGGAD